MRDILPIRDVYLSGSGEVWLFTYRTKEREMYIYGRAGEFERGRFSPDDYDYSYNRTVLLSLIEAVSFFDKGVGLVINSDNLYVKLLIDKCLDMWRGDNFIITTTPSTSPPSPREEGNGESRERPNRDLLVVLDRLLSEKDNIIKVNYIPPEVYNKKISGTLQDILTNEGYSFKGDLGEW